VWAIAALLLIGGAGAWYVWERHHRTTHTMPGGIRMDIALPHERRWELYHNAFSLCSKKTRVCLAELGIDYASHHVDLIETGRYENIGRAFLEVNPAGLVPVLVHDGHPVYESHEQIAYAAMYASSDIELVPTDPAQREIMNRWVHASSLLGDDPVGDLDRTAGNCIPGLTVPIFAAMIQDIPYHRILEGLLFHRLRSRALFFLAIKLRGLDGVVRTRPMLRAIERSRDRMALHFDELEQQLRASGGPWILGERFSLADVGWMVILDRLREVDWIDVLLGGARPLVRRYWEALQARPSYRTAIADFEHPAVRAGADRVISHKSADPDFRAALEGRAE
jgi:glutathione S-transferase